MQDNRLDMPKLLNNDTLYLRAPEPEDLELLYKWENDTDVWKFGSAMSPYSKFALRQYIADAQTDIFQSKQLRFMIALHEGETTVGTIDLYDFDALNSRCGIGIYIDPVFRKNSFAFQSLNILLSYAFNFLKINQLYAVVAESNEASIKLFKSTGFTLSGVLQQWMSYDNVFENAIIVQKINTNRQ